MPNSHDRLKQHCTFDSVCSISLIHTSLYVIRLNVARWKFEEAFPECIFPNNNLDCTLVFSQSRCPQNYRASLLGKTQAHRVGEKMQGTGWLFEITVTTWCVEINGALFQKIVVNECIYLLVIVANIVQWDILSMTIPKNVSWFVLFHLSMWWSHHWSRSFSLNRKIPVFNAYLSSSISVLKKTSYSK